MTQPTSRSSGSTLFGEVCGRIAAAPAAVLFAMLVGAALPLSAGAGATQPPGEPFVEASCIVNPPASQVQPMPKHPQDAWGRAAYRSLFQLDLPADAPRDFDDAAAIIARALKATPEKPPRVLRDALAQYGTCFTFTKEELQGGTIHFAVRLEPPDPYGSVNYQIEAFSDLGRITGITGNTSAYVLRQHGVIPTDR